MTKRIIRNKTWIILFICLIGFLALAEDVFNKEIMQGDIIGYDLLSRYVISDMVTPIAKVITGFGGVYFIVGITILLMFVLRKKEDKLLLALNLIIIASLNHILKQILQRPRPTGYRIVDETGYSFPSGHSMVSMAVYGYLIYLIYQNCSQVYVKWISISMLGVLIVTIGISRIYLGVHYTSDVLAGFLISIAYLILFVKVTKGIIPKKEIG